MIAAALPRRLIGVRRCSASTAGFSASARNSATNTQVRTWRAGYRTHSASARPTRISATVTMLRGRRETTRSVPMVAGVPGRAPIHPTAGAPLHRDSPYAGIATAMQFLHRDCPSGVRAEARGPAAPKGRRAGRQGKRPTRLEKDQLARTLEGRLTAAAPCPERTVRLVCYAAWTSRGPAYRCKPAPITRSGAVPALGQDQVAVAELVPEVPARERLAVAGGQQGGPGDGLGHEEVRRLGLMPAGDEPVDRVHAALGRDDQAGPALARGHGAVGRG